MDKSKIRPESLMMSGGYDPFNTQGAIKPPIFQTSTFAFESAEDGKRFFEINKSKNELEEGREPGLIYSRLTNPNIQILENRLCLWDRSEDAAVFSSGMSAISTVIMEFLKPGDIIVYNSPLYSGTEYFIHHILERFGISGFAFKPQESPEKVKYRLKEAGLIDKVGMIYLETPANPTNDLVDIEAFAKLAKEMSGSEKEVVTVVDNTFMGPLWQHPLKFGADLVIYSATKYLGGHSDLIAGAVLGNKAHLKRIKHLRTYLGNIADPWTGWLLMRSMETLKVRMEQQQENAIYIANYLKKHPRVNRINYLGFLSENSPEFELYRRQYSGSGAMISFEIDGGEKAAFKFLNALRLIKLAVSLGSTESLAEHPRTMTHSSMEEKDLDEQGISPGLIRLSVGLENYEDLISDLEQAFDRAG